MEWNYTAVTRQELYMNKRTRDKRAQALREEGHHVKRSSARNALLHPQYVEDYPYQLSAAGCGLGNTIYKTKFDLLYKVEWY